MATATRVERSPTPGCAGSSRPTRSRRLSPIAIISNVGEGDYCQWIGADDQDYFSIDVSLIRDASLDEYAEADPTAQALTVGGLPAIGSSEQLYVAVDADLLSVVPYLPDSPDPSADPIALATVVAELFIPRLGQLPVPDPDDIDLGLVGDQALADCSIIDLEALNALAPVQYDSVSGGAGACTFASSDLSAGSPFLSITLDPSTAIEDLSVIFPDGTEGDVDGNPSLAAADTLWVQLEHGLLTVSPIYAGSPDAADLDPYEYAADVARLVITALAAAG